MGIVAWKHTHTLLVCIFLLSLTVKYVLLLFNRHSLLDKVRNKTKIFDMVVALLFLATGFYMFLGLLNMQLGGWFHLKLTLVILGIPLGIIAFRKKNKLLATLTMLLFYYVLIMAFTKNYALFFG